MANETPWNNGSHLERVHAEYYGKQIRDIFAPVIGSVLLERPVREDSNIVHDLGGYDGQLLGELLRHHLDDTWQGVVTDLTEPPSVDETVTFIRSPADGIRSHLGLKAVSATISCNTLHLFDDELLTRTIRAVKDTSRSGATFVNIVPHPVTHRACWSDYASRDVAIPTDRRGVFLDEYTDKRVASHAFIPGAFTYPRTVEGFIQPFLTNDFRLLKVEGIHLDRSNAAPERDERYYESLPHLPTYLLTAWEVGKAQ